MRLIRDAHSALGILSIQILLGEQGDQRLKHILKSTLICDKLPPPLTNRSPPLCILLIAKITLKEGGAQEILTLRSESDSTLITTKELTTSSPT